MTTLAGSGAAFYREGVGASASFNTPTGVVFDSTTGLLYVADSLNFCVRTVTTAQSGGVVGQTSTLVGTGVTGQLDGPTGMATLKNPLSVAVLPGGAVVIAEGNGHVLRRLDCGSPSATPSATPSPSPGASPSSSPTPTSSATPTSTPTSSMTATSNGCGVGTYAGNGAAAWSDGALLSSAFRTPGALALDAYGNPAGAALYLADFANALLRVVVIAQGRVNTLAGLATVSGCVDGVGVAARFSSPEAVAVGVNGVYVVDGCNRVRLVTLPSALSTAYSPAVSTIAGNGVASSVDGIAAAASFHFPSGAALAGYSSSLLFVAGA